MADAFPPSRAPAKHLVVVGASAGGIDALRELFSRFPADFAAPIAVVLHTSPQSPGILHEILSRAGPLPALSAASGMRIEPGHVYVAPPDHHLLVEPGRFIVTKGPRENRFRPAIDPLFRSAAQVYGPGAVGVVLTGNLDDGTAGLWAIKQLGGTAIVQDPHDALFPSMPTSAILNVTVDYVLPLAEIARVLARLTAGPVQPPAPAPAATDGPVDIEIRIAKEEDPLDAGLERIATPSPFACPECHGVLLKLKEAGRTRFRCHTGHAYSLDSLVAEMDDAIEGAMWNAVRVLHEGAMLVSHMLQHLDGSQDEPARAALAERARDLHRRADTVREMLGADAPLRTDR
jgi:two-component system chemotaxis response regulator CheB